MIYNTIKILSDQQKYGFKRLSCFNQWTVAQMIRASSVLNKGSQSSNRCELKLH